MSGSRPPFSRSTRALVRRSSSRLPRPSQPSILRMLQLARNRFAPRKARRLSASLSRAVKEARLVLSCGWMRVSPFPAMLLVMLASACGRQVPIDHQSEWRDVLKHKRAAVAPDASPDHKQAYADSVRAFVVKHPSHGRAVEV